MKHWRELLNDPEYVWEWTSQVAIEIKLKVKLNDYKVYGLKSVVFGEQDECRYVLLIHF